MRYELKYEDFNKDVVHPVPGDILVLHTGDCNKVIVCADRSSDGITCSKCRLSNMTEECPRIDCDSYNFSCPIETRIYFTSIDTLLEDL